MPSNNRTCATCANREETPTGEVTCHRFPPQMIALPRVNVMRQMEVVPAAAFPVVAALGWCGEFAPDIV